MITYKIYNQHIKRIPCDQREYSADLFTGNLEKKIKERTVITIENVKTGLLNGSAHKGQ